MHVVSFFILYSSQYVHGYCEARIVEVSDNRNQRPQSEPRSAQPMRQLRGDLVLSFEVPL